MKLLRSLVRRALRYSLVVATVAAGVGGWAAMVGNGWKNFESKDRLTFLTCSAYEHQLYLGFLKVKAPAMIADFVDTDRPDGSWFFMWEYPGKSRASKDSKNLGPMVDFGSLLWKPGPQAYFDHRIGRFVDGKFAGIYLRCGNSLFSFSLADEPVYRKGSDEPIYRRNGSTSVQANIPGWVLCGLSAAGFVFIGMRLHGRLRSNRQRKRGRCPKCHYDLRATPNRCPECGFGQI